MKSNSKNPSIYTQISTQILQQLKRKYNKYDGTPFSFVEISHRSKQYNKLNCKTKEMIKNYFNLSKYECLLMPPGSFGPSLFFNFPQQLDETYYYVMGEDSQRCYKQIQRCNPNTKKVTSLNELMKICNQKRQTQTKILLHINQIDEGLSTNIPELTPKLKQHVTIIRNLNYCFPWPSNKAVTDDIIYYESETGYSIPGFCVILIKQQLLQKLEPKEICPDMFNFCLMNKQQSIVNTPFTLCTLVMYYNIKYAHQNKENIIQKIKQNKEIFKRKLMDNGYSLVESRTNGRKEAENMIRIKVENINEKHLNRIIDEGIGKKIKEKNQIWCFIQLENTNFISFLNTNQ